MKTIIRFTFICLVLFSFFIAIKRFETHLFNQYSNYFNPKQNDQIYQNDNQVNEVLRYRYLVINFNGIEIDEREFINDFEIGLDKYDINAYQGFQDNYGITLFLYTKDKEYINNLSLEKGEILDLVNFETYSTQHEKAEQKLYLPLNQKIIQIYPLNNIDHPKRNVQSSYILTVNQERLSELSVSISKFRSFLLSKYSGISLDIREVNLSQTIVNKIEATDYYLYFIVCMLIMLMISTEIMNNSKRISLMKIEGLSDLSIYKSMYINPIMEYISMIVVVQIFLFGLIVKLKFSQSVFFIETLLKLNIISLVLFLILGIYVYYSICIIPINSSIKGRNALSKLILPANILKLVSILVSIPIILSGTKSSIELFNSSYSENQYLDSIIDRYIPLYVKREYSGKALNEDEIKQMEIMKRELEARYDLLYMQKSPEMLIVENEQKESTLLPNFYYVNEEYLNRYNLFLQDGYEMYIYCHEECQFDANLIAYYHQIDKSNLSISILESDIKFENFDNSRMYPIQLYLPSNSILVYFPNYSTTLSSIDSFVFNGNTQNAQNFLDTLSNNYKIPQKYRLVSYLELYNQEKSVNFAKLRIDIWYMLLVVFQYACLVINHLTLYKFVYEKKLALLEIEGYSKASILFHRLFQSIYFLLIVTVIILIIYPISLIQIIQILIFIIVTEITLGYLFNIKWRKLNGNSTKRY